MSLSFLITLGLAVVILAVAAGMAARTRAARPAVIGAGLAALVVGYWLTGWTQLTINGIASLIDWFHRTALTTPVAWGTGLLVGGVIVAVVGTLLPKGSGQPPKTPGRIGSAGRDGGSGRGNEGAAGCERGARTDAPEVDVPGPEGRPADGPGPRGRRDRGASAQARHHVTPPLSTDATLTNGRYPS